MGDAEGNGKGDFLLIDAEKGVVKGKVILNIYYKYIVYIILNQKQN